MPFVQLPTQPSPTGRTGPLFGSEACAQRTRTSEVPRRTLARVDDDLTRLALAARDGDRTALHTLVRATQKHVWRFCAYLVDVDTADDLTQETFARAFGSLARFRGDAPVRAWLLPIARRVCADEIRARRRRRTIDAATPAADTDFFLAATPAASDGAEAVALRALIDELPDDRREAFVLTRLVGLSYVEAAEHLSVPVGTIRSRVARAREALVARLRAAEALDPAGLAVGAEASVP